MKNKFINLVFINFKRLVTDLHKQDLNPNFSFKNNDEYIEFIFQKLNSLSSSSKQQQFIKTFENQDIDTYDFSDPFLAKGMDLLTNNSKSPIFKYLNDDNFQIQLMPDYSFVILQKFNNKTDNNIKLFDWIKTFLTHLISNQIIDSFNYKNTLISRYTRLKTLKVVNCALIDNDLSSFEIEKWYKQNEFCYLSNQDESINLEMFYKQLFWIESYYLRQSYLTARLDTIDTSNISKENNILFQVFDIQTMQDSIQIPKTIFPSFGNKFNDLFQQIEDKMSSLNISKENKSYKIKFRQEVVASAVIFGTAFLSLTGLLQVCTWIYERAYGYISENNYSVYIIDKNWWIVLILAIVFSVIIFLGSISYFFFRLSKALIIRKQEKTAIKYERQLKLLRNEFDVNLSPCFANKQGFELNRVVEFNKIINKLTK
ncbi:hypothetical protein [Mycoplasma nasistruthionis]|uniref:Uncharacterized protein n=1 Tax=Mycoplasma nasistruthionis TaxID=353852 RepID=A0A5B7XVM9_9MOLU|nr:hypothetical protein [Mycoplasma nasistruthionis]QCZ36918.1 hypothetical protein FG904_02805 [Mycoplasma nasistruthionis]